MTIKKSSSFGDGWGGNKKKKNKGCEYIVENLHPFSVCACDVMYS